jgi:hypothetical protein
MNRDHSACQQLFSYLHRKIRPYQTGDLKVTNSRRAIH